MIADCAPPARCRTETKCGKPWRLVVEGHCEGTDQCCTSKSILF